MPERFPVPSPLSGRGGSTARGGGDVQRARRYGGDHRRRSRDAHHKSDQHAWHDLANGAIYAHNIGDGLGRADPANADFYKTRADAYIADIKQLDAWAKAEIA